MVFEARAKMVVFYMSKVEYRGIPQPCSFPALGEAIGEKKFSETLGGYGEPKVSLVSQ